MANEKISGLPAIATIASNDVLPIVDVSAGTAGSKKVTVSQLAAEFTPDLTPYLQKAGGTMTGALTLSGDPSTSLEPATKQYVDNLLNGLKWKAAVRIATTTAGTLATSFENGDTVDGVVIATGDRILIKDQAAPAENGIYTVNASGAPTRATDFDVWIEIVSAAMFVQEGTSNADTSWTCTVNAGGTIGVTSITFAQVSGGNTQASLDIQTLTFIGNDTINTGSFVDISGMVNQSFTVTQDGLIRFTLRPFVILGSAVFNIFNFQLVLSTGPTPGPIAMLGFDGSSSNKFGTSPVTASLSMLAGTYDVKPQIRLDAGTGNILIDPSYPFYLEIMQIVNS